MGAFDNKYGFSSEDNSVKSFHSQRQMFAIKNSNLFLAPANVTYSHTDWFIKEGWMSSKDDSLMDQIVRGFIDPTGAYFYKGYNFDADPDAEKEMFQHLCELVRKTGIDTSLHLYGGLIKHSTPGRFPPENDYGAIKNYL
ncbi:MAG: hypothetical protein ACQESE_04995 [Nanobdellota archaeon]